MGKLDIKKIIILLDFIFVQQTIHSQGFWDLDSCINFGLKNNLSIKENYFNITQNQIIKKQTLRNYLPSLNGYVSNGDNWGQTIDPFTNKFASDRVRTSNLNINSSWILFNGLQNYHLTQKANLETNYQLYNHEVQKRNLKIDITAHYLQILLNNRKLLNARIQIDYTSKIYKRTQELVRLEELTEYSLLEIESQLALDSLMVTKALNELLVSKLKLNQILNISIDGEKEISLLLEDEIIPKVDSINLLNLPEIKQIEERIKINNLNFKISKYKLLPNLTLNTSLGTGYSGNNKEIIGTNFIPKPFIKQFDENFYRSATFVVNIPIFNKGTISKEIAINKIEIEKSILQKKQSLLDLQNKIELLKFELENLIFQKKSALIALNLSEKTLEMAEIKYNEGLINFTNLLEIRKKHIEAESQFLNTSFELIFKSKILSFYNDPI